VPKKPYETERVPVARTTRIQHIVVSSICIIAGLAIFVLNASAPPGPDKFAPEFLGALLGGVGIFFLVYSIRKTHEPVLTESGRAAKAADDRIQSEKQAKREAAFWVFAFWAAVIAGIVYAYDPIVDQFEGRVAAYPIYCAVAVPETGACAKNGERAANVTKYIVHVDQQIVVGLTEKTTSREKLFNCVVADMRNWSCSLEPDRDSIHAVMSDGVFSYNPPSLLNEFRFAPRWKYLLVKYLNDK
jgi:hypothetical protein